MKDEGPCTFWPFCARARKNTAYIQNKLHPNEIGGKKETFFFSFACTEMDINDFFFIFF